MIEANKVQLYMKGGSELVRAVKHTLCATTSLDFVTTLSETSSDANALEHVSVEHLADMFSSALKDHKAGMDIVGGNDPRLQVSNCANLSLWQSGRQQCMQTPGPTITDVPMLYKASYKLIYTKYINIPFG